MNQEVIVQLLSSKIIKSEVLWLEAEEFREDSKETLKQNKIIFFSKNFLTFHCHVSPVWKLQKPAVKPHAICMRPCMWNCTWKYMRQLVKLLATSISAGNPYLEPIHVLFAAKIPRPKLWGLFSCRFMVMKNENSCNESQLFVDFHRT